MLLEHIYDEDLAQASYVIGCQAKGEAIVIDPRRDLTPYLDLAARKGMRVVAVTETHIHADYLSGSRELAAATGATLYVSGEGGEDWQYEFEAERLRHGDAITIGNLTIEARRTPALREPPRRVPDPSRLRPGPPGSRRRQRLRTGARGHRLDDCRLRARERLVGRLPARPR